MVPKKTLKLIKSLQLKKYRHQEKLFLVEGAKSIAELLASSFRIKTLIGTPVFIDQHMSLIQRRSPAPEVLLADESVISSAGSFKNNNAGIAVVEMLTLQLPPETISGYALALDTIRDPGNLGTIIRVADWYGISAIISSPETADEYNPKVIGASMGSFLRVPFYRTELVSYLQKVTQPVYGTLVNQGVSVHELNFAKQGLIVLGNESEGISPEVADCVTQAVHIPCFGEAESLNVSMATAIICDNLRRSTSR